MDITITTISINQAPSYIRGGPECNCGNRDWIIKENSVKCSYCDRVRNGTFDGYISDRGPECNCGNRGWFVSANRWVCSFCARVR